MVHREIGVIIVGTVKNALIALVAVFSQIGIAARTVPRYFGICAELWHHPADPGFFMSTVAECLLDKCLAYIAEVAFVKHLKQGRVKTVFYHDRIIGINTVDSNAETEDRINDACLLSVFRIADSHCTDGIHSLVIAVIDNVLVDVGRLGIKGIHRFGTVQLNPVGMGENTRAINL